MRRSLPLVLAALGLFGCAENPAPQPQYSQQPPPPPVVAEPLPQQPAYQPPPSYQPPPEQPGGYTQPAQYSPPPEQYPAPVAEEYDVDNDEAPPPPAMSEVVDDYPVGQPEPVAAPATPPPYIEEDPGYAPWEGAMWVHGFWRWRGEWIWIRGRWARPPMPNYVYVDPYYECRGGEVVIIEGHWQRPGIVFVVPPPRHS
jgi:hypothetical protein